MSHQRRQQVIRGGRRAVQHQHQHSMALPRADWEAGAPAHGVSRNRQRLLISWIQIPLIRWI